MARLVIAAALLAAVFQAPPARAELPPAAAPPGESDASATALPAAPPNSQDAARLYYEAEALYADGDIPGALARMQGAYALSGRPELLFNLGELRGELGHCMAARKNYLEYLARMPDGRKRSEAKRKESELGQHCPDSAPPATPAAPATVAADRYWTPATIAGWATIGAGVAAAASGTYFAVQANRDQRHLEERIGGGEPFTQADKQLELDGQRSAAWARGLFAGAAALVATGVSLLVLQPGSSKPTTTFAVGFDTRTVTAAWRGPF